MDQQKIRSLLKEHCHIHPDLPIVVGVSGGPDSLSLFHLLYALGYPVIAAHFDHQLRPDSLADATHVQAIAESLGLPCEIGSLDVRACASQQKMSIEEAARTARYQFLFKVASQYNAQAVAVGHTADDQVETTLMHLLRGSGLSGLKGMTPYGIHPQWSQEIALIRPLLYSWRSETVAYCQEQGLTPVYDPTNDDLVYFRNRLRHELIPYLQSYNPNVKEVLLRTTRSLASDFDALSQMSESAWEQCFVERYPRAVVLSISVLRAFHRSLQRAMIRKGIANLRPGLRDIDFDPVERAVDFLSAPTQSRSMTVANHIFLFLEGDRLWIADEGFDLVRADWPQLEHGDLEIPQLPVTIEIGNGWFFACRLEPKQGSGNPYQPGNPFTACLDGNAVGLPLSLRGRHAGDRFLPLGMNGHSLKLSDFFVNVQLPRPARDHWPLVVSGGQIAWIPGYRPGELFRVQEKTQILLILSLYH
jgi:tRNA(Ile)-lysidine synthase